MRSKIKISDIFAYIIGNYRMYFYYGGWWSKRFSLIAWLRKRVLRTYIKEQIAWRLSVMNRECYSSGSCVKCGCDTPALQMANKACEGGCYFEMYDKKKWEAFKITIEKRKQYDHTKVNFLGFEDRFPKIQPKSLSEALTPDNSYIVGYDPYKEEKDSI